MSRQASCQCGGFRATVATEPAIVVMCHCTQCQRRSGVPLTVNTYFKKDDVELAGDFRIFERPAPEGRKVYNYFCPTCGTTLGMAWRCTSRRDRSCRRLLRRQEPPHTERVDLGGDDASMDQVA
jgi:hypothetical protein